MPIHDWSRVDGGIFHSSHLNWIAEMDKALNGGLLPTGFYSLAEQHAGKLKQTVGAAARTRRRTLTVRGVSGHRLVALIEVVSPANKDRPSSVSEFVGKIVAALASGVHALVLDLFPPGNQDVCGMHGAIWRRLERTEEPYDLPADESLTLASYVAGEETDIYLGHPTVGEPLKDMPLFLRPDRYIYAPLEATYHEAYRSMPAFWRKALEAGDSGSAESTSDL